jgi:hypothetical protein
MKRNQLLLFSLILLCLATPAPAADINATSCSQADVQAAIDSAVDGDRVLVPAGTCTWSSQVLVQNKGITFEGAGIGQTTIVNNLTSDAVLRFNFQAGDPMTDVTGFTFDANNLNTGGKPFISLNGGGLNAFRMHHFEMVNLKERGIRINMDGLEVSGLIDNCTFEMPATNGSKAIHIFGTESENSDPFSRPMELGSEKFIFVEDCTFDFADVNDGAQDASGGARYVFRHNTIVNSHPGHHGADSGGYRGVHSFEIYENTFNRTVSNNVRLLYFRSSTGVVYNNTYTGNYGFPEMNNYRSCQSNPPWGSCDGTSSWDENSSGGEGYACLDQIGHIFTENSGGSNDLEPLYFWSNTLDGSQANIHVVGFECSRLTTLHVIEDRDFYNEDASFNGTSGIGVGTLASRPSTCTPDVGYWATDESKLYRCTATDTWTLKYTPFTYPHPLRGEGTRPDPPTNLRVVVQ